MAGVPHAFTAVDFVRRARERLHFELPPDVFDTAALPSRGDHALDGLDVRARLKGAKPAAVLIAVVKHPDEATLVLTQRLATLRTHSGQIALPGGRIDQEDPSPMAAALREAKEEIGLDPDRLEPLGYLDPYLTGTGYLIVPTVAVADPPLIHAINPTEVAEVFEVPLAFLMDPANHHRHSREFGGTLRSFYAMPYAERYIWGVTAGVLRNLYERLYGACCGS